MKKWEMVKLGEIITISKGKKYQEVPFKNSRFRYINIEDLHGGKQHRYTNDKGVLVTKDEVLIAWDGANAGKVGVGFDGVIGSTLARLTLKNKQVFPKFLFWFLESQSDFIKSQRTGATIPHINGSVLKELPIPLPPLATQKRIAEILDKADALRQKDQALLRKYDELAQAMFIDMFGDPVKNEKGWEVKELKEVVNNHDKKRVPVKESDRQKLHGEYPYYGATGIIDYVNDFIFDGKFLLIAEDGKNLLFRKRKNAFLAEGKFWVNNHAHILSFNGKVILSFLEFYLNQIDLKPYVTGIDQFKLTRTDLDRIEVFVPPLSQQNKFADIFANIEQQKGLLIKQQIESEALFGKLLQESFE